MSKEWLEDKKKQLNNATIFINENGNEAVEVSLSVLNKLIKQAERVQELEEKNRKLNFAIGSYSLQVSEISQMIEREVQGMKKLSNRMVKGESE